MVNQKDIKLLLVTGQSLINKLNNFEQLLSSTSIPNLDESAFLRLKLHTDNIKGLHEKYDDIMIQLQVATADSNELLSSDEFNNNCINLIARATILLNTKTNSNEVQSSAHGGHISPHSSISNNGCNAKLPQISLPSFDGNLTEFQSYYESFISLIHNNQNLTDVERFIYLKGSLKGIAAQSISNIQPSAENYKIAFELICERYNNPKLIILNHIKGIFDLRSIIKPNSIELRKLFDELSKHIRALKNLSVSIEHCSPFIYHIIMTKLDNLTKIKLTEFNPRGIPTVDEIIQFLKQHCQTLEEIDSSNKSSNNVNYYNPSKPTQRANSKFQQTLLNTPSKISCSMCKAEHYLIECPKFSVLSAKQKLDKVYEFKLCKNCLRHSNQNQCNSKFSCRICRKRHHTFLHIDNQNSATNQSQSDASVSQVTTSSESESQALPSTSLSCTNNSMQVLLSTALVTVKGSNNTSYSVRVLLDSGSHCNLITNSLVKRLELPKNKINTKISGISSSSIISNSTVNVQLASRQTNFVTNLQCLTIEKITDNLPLYSFEKANLKIPQNIRLADDRFNESLPIDLLIGANHFYNLLCIGQISLGKCMPTLQKTLLGWVVSGAYCNNLPSIVHSHVSIQELSPSDESLENCVHQLWKLDDVELQNPLSKLSQQEQFCENYFAQTVSRTSSGRFIVSIPFNSNLALLGYSEQQARERFLKLENKLMKSPELYKSYSEFMQEYISLGHMITIDDHKNVSQEDRTIQVLDGSISLSKVPPFYLPHHGVIKSTSLTTKLRVVFDGSFKSTSGISINDSQLVGPVLQNDLFAILLRFRQHRFALTGDIEKMYRQILIHPAERKFQRILWRDNPASPISTYQLQTITYGTASASYLSTKCLSYLSELNFQKFPKGAAALESDFYVDDLITGADSVEELLNVKTELSSILSSAGFSIRKFLSNHDQLLNNDTPSQAFHTIPIGERKNSKTLGLTWNSLNDTIQYSILTPNTTRISENSKRTILSAVAQLFDPLGLLSPITIIGKLLIQQLWQLKLSWDETIPQSLNSEWNFFKNDLSILGSIKIPRSVIPYNASIEVHGFSDSSSKAYGACIYIRCFDCYNNVSCQLLCSKSRVAPLRTTTIPRLELCAALLLAQLMKKVTESLRINTFRSFFWTDSTITLNWIKSTPNKYKIFVANRIASILEMSDPKDWYYVPSKINPADFISRGLTPTNLSNNLLWWQGPPFLSSHGDPWPEIPTTVAHESDSELKGDKLNIFVTTQDESIFHRFSNLTKLKRVVAWILRFVKNSKTPKTNRSYENLQPHELTEALRVLLKLCQKTSFPLEINALKFKRKLKTSSTILSLNPFLDEHGLIRVGGRIRHSNFEFNKKFPILLPKGHIFTKLILRHFHDHFSHCGPQHLLAIIRETYWPISGLNTSKQIVRTCIKCFKVNPKSYNPLMGNLPNLRLQSNIPVFAHVGVDYAGPILIKDRKLRGSKLIKSYICLFICLVTKAIHLELATSLTSDAFISVLKRFIGRRGKPVHIMSDNASYFVKAANDINAVYKMLQYNNKNISDFLANEHIKWSFIIPQAPHQGGIWESGVKTVKVHLKRVLQNTSLNYEDFATTLIQIEAVLNSRPLSPLSTDPSDLNPLTPGHFLIGRPLHALPTLNLDDIKENRLSLYQRMQRIVECFWRQWSLQVVPEFQRRAKWFKNLPNIVQVGSLVLLKETNLPPLQWLLGRVTEVHQSSDNIVRSVTVRVANGNYLKRTVNKLCVLPTSLE